MDIHFKIQISYLKVLGQAIKQSLRHQELTTTYTMETLLPQLIHYYQLECTLYLYLMIFHLRPYPLLFFSELTVQVNTLKYLYRITRIKFAILVHNCKYTIQNTWTQLQEQNFKYLCTITSKQYHPPLTPPLYSYRTVGSDFGGVLHQRPPVYRLPLEKELHARDDSASSLLLPCLLPAQCIR